MRDQLGGNGARAQDAYMIECEHFRRSTGIFHFAAIAATKRKGDVGSARVALAHLAFVDCKTHTHTHTIARMSNRNITPRRTNQRLLCRRSQAIM